MWLDKIEESNRRAQEVRKRHVTLSSKELPRERMARVLRELAVVVKHVVIDDKYYNPIGVFDAHSKLSDDAKELLE